MWLENINSFIVDEGYVLLTMQHDPTTINGTLPSRLEQLRHIAIVCWKVKFPGCERIVELPILPLPLLDIRQRTDIYRLLQEFMDPRQNP